jgi:hypothetical protein
MMLPALTKPLESLTAADLEELIRRRWPESENVEYKSEFHRERPNQPDSWYSGGNIFQQAKNKIFKELIAFANTSGGRLFLGITETRDRPPRADTIQPVPRWVEVAAAEAIASAEAFRGAVQSPGCEYCLQLELVATDGRRETAVQLATVSRGFTNPLGLTFETPATLGPYSLGDRDSVVNLIFRDLLDASGEAVDWPRLEIDWTSFSR